MLRIGINLGDVIVVGRDLYGDGLNVAARLETLAEPGSIYLSRSVYDQVKRKLDFDCRSYMVRATAPEADCSP